ncbi:MAG TPA: cell division protein SepF [Clostridia bacterium]|nr:cell division protein SepF [Clostridia bacterium]
MAFADVLHRLGQMIGLYAPDQEVYEAEDDPFEEEEYEAWEEEPVRAAAGRGAQAGAYVRPKTRFARQDEDEPAPRRPVRDNVVHMPSRDGREVREPQAPSRHSAIIMYVRRKEDGQQIISYVLEGRSVILNCEEIDDAQCQRVIDILSGAAFALGGRIQRVSHRNYLFVPASVEIVSGEPARYTEPFR